MRTKNSIKNLTSGFIGQVLYALLGFAVRTVFIYLLTEEYLGVNGLLGSIFAVLNLANLGIDNAIIYAMYKPMAENDISKLKSLLYFFRKSYQIIGFVFLGVGLAVFPFLDYLVKGSTELVNIRIIYLLILFETACSYWFFAYLASVPVCDQKQYLITEIGYITDFITAAIRIAALFALKKAPVISFYVYTGIGIASKIFNNILVRARVRRLYPWVQEKNIILLSKEEKKPIFQNVTGMTTNNVCRVLNDGIDSTIVSAFLGLEAVGIFSNYLVLRNYVYLVMRTFFNSLSASIGNMCATESKERQEKFFLSLQFACFWIYGLGAICFFVLLDSFIAGVWLHDTKWLLSKWDVLLISFNFLIEGMAKSVISFRDARGLFWQTRYRYILSSVFNAVISIVFVGPLHMGVTGALLGTTASLFIMLSYDPVLVYREIFEKKAKEYYFLYLKNIGIVFCTAVPICLLCRCFSEYTLPNFIIRLIVCIVVPNGIWFLLFRKTDEFQYLKNATLGAIRSFFLHQKTATTE